MVVMACSEVDKVLVHVITSLTVTPEIDKCGWPHSLRATRANIMVMKKAVLARRRAMAILT